MPADTPTPAEDVATAAAYLEVHADQLEQRSTRYGLDHDPVEVASHRARAQRLYDLARRIRPELNPTLDSSQQLLVAERLVDAFPELDLTVGQGLAVLAVVLEQLGAPREQVPA